MTENKTGQDLINERADLPVYGDRIQNMIDVALIWSGITGYDIQPTHVPLMLAAMKIQRSAKTPDYSDSSDDVDGYMAIFREVVGDDMIHARTADDYREQKRLREQNKTHSHVHVTRIDPPIEFKHAVVQEPPQKVSHPTDVARYVDDGEGGLVLKRVPINNHDDRVDEHGHRTGKASFYGDK